MSISAIIPNFNHAPFLAARIESVLGQTYSNLECIILDDGSLDGSQDIIRSYAEKDKRVRQINFTSNSGNTFVQWNRGVREAKYDLIWIAESDDTADENMLDALLKSIDQDERIVLSFCQSKRVDAEGQVTGSWKDYTDGMTPDIFSQDFILAGTDYINKYLIHKNTIPNASAVLFRKSIYESIGGADEELPTNSDWLTWLKMCCIGHIAFVPEPLNLFRYHKGSVIAKDSISSSMRYREKYSGSMRMKFKQYLKTNGISLTNEAHVINDRFISWERGNEGLYMLGAKKFFTGWAKVLQASFYPVFQTGFIKKAISAK